VGLTIGVDIGGTKVLGGVVDSAGDVLVQTRRDTPAQDPGETADRIIDVIKELGAAHDVQAVGIGAAGWVDATRSIVQFAPNLAWRDEPLRERIEELVKLPVVVENDANAAAFGEYRHGAGRGSSHMVMLTVGTGIGGGIVLGGELYRGAFGVASEFGHIQVVRDGLLCGCGGKGCFEQYCSGKALVREAKAGAERDPATAERLLELAGGTVAGVQGLHVTQAAHEGDPVSVAAFDSIATWLGQGLCDIVFGLDPDRIVVGGGVIDAGDLLMEPALAAYQ
jgi:glucokinase